MESLKHASKVNNPFSKKSNLGKTWDVVETPYHNSWKIEFGVLLHQRKAKTLTCDSETFEHLMLVSKELAETYVLKQKELNYRYPYEKACKFVAFKARNCMNNGQEAHMDLTINNRIKKPFIDVIPTTVWENYGRKTYSVTEYKSKIVCGKRHLSGLEAAYRIGVVDKLTTLYYNEETFEAVWCRRSNKGLVVVNGFMKPFENTYVHGSTLKELDENIKLRTENKEKFSNVADYSFARSLGFCAEGIKAWCVSHGISVRSKLTREQLLTIDPSNPYVQKLVARMTI